MNANELTRLEQCWSMWERRLARAEARGDDYAFALALRESMRAELELAAYRAKVAS